MSATYTHRQLVTAKKRQMKCMDREKLVHIWFVLRIWEFIVNYGDFICVPCVLYIGLVEKF